MKKYETKYSVYLKVGILECIFFLAVLADN
jgi:hypothetical protein